MRILKQELYFPIIIGIHFLFWAIDLSLYSGDFIEPRSDTLLFGEYENTTGIHPSRIVGEVFSSWVVTVFAFNFLMATRARWVERIFGGLDKMYVIHRRSGVIAVVLLLAHFVAVPRDLTAFTVGKPLGFYALILILLGVVAAVAPPVKKRLRYHAWLRSHRLMGVFYVMGVAHAGLVFSLIQQLPITRVYVFGMAGVGVVSWVYRAFLYRRFNPELPYEVSAVRKLDARTTEIDLKPLEGSLAFAPGQFAFFRFPKVGQGEAHPFTIASTPGDGGLRIAVRALGDDTSNMQGGVEAGDRVFVEGPFGHFTAEHAGDQKQIWVAGGIGITPFLSLAKAVGDRDVRLIWCVANRGDAFYAEELQALAEGDGGFGFEVWPSEEKGTFSLAALELAGVDDTTFMVCGPPGLKDALRKQVLERGGRSSSVLDEEFAFR